MPKGTDDDEEVVTAIGGGDDEEDTCPICSEPFRDRANGDGSYKECGCNK